MAKKKSHRRPSPPKDQLEQFRDETENADEIIEYDPEAEDSRINLSAKQVPHESRAVTPDEGLLAAKSELIARLGGPEILASAAQTAASGDRVGAENVQAVRAAPVSRAEPG